jgi:hypothetical protein
MVMVAYSLDITFQSKEPNGPSPAAAVRYGNDGLEAPEMQ